MLSKESAYIIVCITAIISAYIKTVLWILGSWIMNPYYSHGFLVLLISLYLCYKKWRKPSLGWCWTGLYVLAVSMIIHVFFILNSYYWLSAVCLPISVLSCIYIFDKNLAKTLAFPVLFVLLAIPYPIYGIANWMESLSANSAAAILNAIGVKTKVVGAEITTAKNSFVVGAPCSGIRSVLALITVTIFYTYIIETKILIKSILTLLSVFVAALTNIARIVIVVLFAEKFGVNFTMKYIHAPIDIILFVLAVLLIVAAEKILGRVAS